MSNYYFNEMRARAEIIQKFMEEDDFDFDKVIPMPESLKADFSTENVTNQDPHDDQTWVEFCMENWSTKGNATDTFYCGDDIVSFETVWSAPYRIFEKICEIFPTEKITFFSKSAEGVITEFENRSGSLKLTSYAETVWDDTANEHIVRAFAPVKTTAVRDAAYWLWEKIERASSDEEIDLACKECEEKFGVHCETRKFE